MPGIWDHHGLKMKGAKVADHVKVLVYVPAAQARELRERGVKDIPTWVRQLVKDTIKREAQ